MPHKKIVLLFIAFSVGLTLAFLLYRADERLGQRLASSDAGLRGEEPPRRIVLLSTAAEEVLVSLDAGDLIVGTTGYSVFSQSHPRVQKVGGVMDINFEMLSRLKPDLVIAQTRDPRLERFAKERRIRFVRIDIEKIDDLLRLARDLGRMIGRREAGEALASQIKAGLSHLKIRSDATPKVPCFVTVDRSPGQMTQILTTGKTTFINELLDIAGCRNIFSDLNARYPVVSKESLAARAPAVIIELKPTLEPLPSALIEKMQADWRLFGAIPAVANRRIHIITNPEALIAGPHVVEPLGVGQPVGPADI